MATADPVASAPFGPAWLATRRWFRAKHRPLADVSVADRARLADGIWLVVLAAAYADGGVDRYLVVATEDDGSLREPRNGEGAWEAIVRRIADHAEIHGEHGRFRFDPGPALAELVPSARVAAAILGERRLAVEQTNTSVVLGERLIVKLYRLLEPGINPDLEVSAFLSEAGFAHVPALAGSARYLPSEGEPSAVAMLQAFIQSRGDAWGLMLDTLATDPSAGSAMAARIGAITAQMHAALASRPTDPAFPARPATVDETAAWRAGAEEQLAAAIAAVSGPAHDRLVELAPALRARYADAFGSATGASMVSRIHGDYHLGQLLAMPDGGFVVIDFEGEPARPLDERRRPTSPLRDVAGMLRSLDYAARRAERTAHTAGFDPDHWLARARGDLLGAYGRIGPDEAPLLDAFELEKACYEVRYEASNRPEWLWLPLAALERLGR
jgi:trehalose synthase-fused probable maltokinase